MPHLELLVASDPAIKVIAVTESWGSASIRDSEFHLQGFHVFRGDRPTHGGGALLLIHQSLTPFPPPACPAHPDVIAVSMVTQNNRRIVICCAYRSPSNSPETDTALLDYIANLGTIGCDELLLVGDFNYPQINWLIPHWPQSCENFMATIFQLGLSQFVFESTRQNNILDLVFSNGDSVCNLTVGPSIGRSDHDTVHFELSYGPPAMPSRQRLCWSRADWCAISNHITMNTDVSDLSLSVDACWSAIKTSIQDAVSLHVPRASATSSRRPVWADYACWSAIRIQTNSHRTFRRRRTHQSWENYRAKSFVADFEVRRSKRKYFHSLAANINKRPRLFWRHVNSKVKSTGSVSSIRDTTGAVITSPMGIANVLNHQFESVFQVEDTSNLPPCPSRTAASLDMVDFSPVTVAQTLCKLKARSSPGPDSIPNLLLQKCHIALAQPLSCLFGKSFASHSLPGEWLYAHVVPIFKKGSTLDPANYRPISLTSSCSKAMESIIKTAVTEFADVNGLINDSQHGFRSKRSTVTQLIDFMDGITASIDDGVPVDAVLLDFRKAFDVVPHERLLLKLASHGIGGNCLAWIRAFLSGRTQSAVVGSNVSAPCSVTSGVPQGSVLGPTLFVFYINDFDDGIVSRVCKFADDTSLVCPLPPPVATSSAILQHDLNTASDWAATWLMSFGVAKCATLHFGFNNDCISYLLCGETIAEPDSERYLGCTVTNNLKPSLHCQQLAFKAHALIGLLYRSFGRMEIVPFLLIYRALVRPALEYASQAWSPYRRGDIDLLERVQRRATRLVIGTDGLSYEDRLRLLKLQTLETRRLRADLILVYRMFHGLIAYDWRRLFSLSTNRLRGHEFKLEKHRARLDLRHYCFSFRVINPWNQLPSAVVTAPSVSAFKRRLHDSGALGEL